ncbi:MAG: hypothetical protein ABIJ59_16435 [Pseudomonadota bacterium]
MKTKVLSKSNVLWEKHYSSKENMNVLLKAMELNDYEFGGIQTTYTINENRYAFGMFVKNKSTGKLLSIYVDAIQGYPSWDQCMDTTFNLGSDYDKRVIMFCDDKIDPQGFDELNNIDVVENFVEIINGSGLDTYFIQVNGLDKKDSEVPLDYFVLVNPLENKASIPFKKLPSKNDFHWARFNIIFCGTMQIERYLYLEPNEWMNPCGCPDSVKNIKMDMPGSLKAIEIMELTFIEKSSLGKQIDLCIEDEKPRQISSEMKARIKEEGIKCFIIEYTYKNNTRDHIEMEFFESDCIDEHGGSKNSEIADILTSMFETALISFDCKSDPDNPESHFIIDTTTMKIVPCGY